MKEKEKLIRYISVQYNCLEELGKYLEEMTKNGWMLEEISARTKFIFKKCEPKKIKFSVNIFPGGSEYDTHPTEENLEYNEFCKNAGWNFVCTSGPIHIFVSENENAEDIDTDPVIKLNAINRLMRPQIITGGILAVMAIITIVYNLTLNLNNMLMSFVAFLIPFIWSLALLLWVVKICRCDSELTDDQFDVICRDIVQK